MRIRVRVLKSHFDAAAFEQTATDNLTSGGGLAANGVLGQVVSAAFEAPRSVDSVDVELELDVARQRLRDGKNHLTDLVDAGRGWESVEECQELSEVAEEVGDRARRGNRIVIGLVVGAALLLLVLGAIVLSGCSDSNAGCTATNCQTAIYSCHLTVDGDPTSFCLDALLAAGTTLTADPSTTAIAECEKACTRSAAGDTLACLDANAALCASPDGGVSTTGATSAAVKCASTRVSDATCVSACAAAFKTCVLACPATSLDACLPCGDTCADTYEACKLKCPWK